MKKNILVIFILAAFALTSSGQGKISVSGKVVDSSQKPVKGAAIIVDQQNTGKITNGKGIFKLKIDPSAKTIGVFTQDGRTAEQPYSGGKEVLFTLDANFAGVEKTRPPDEPGEQVNIGYGSVDRKNLVSPVTKVDASKDAYAYKDIYEMLKGKPGVTVSGRNIRIQGGINSFNLSTEPLFVVDGVISNSIDDIIPQSVKSIEILKGSSAAIYGSRGANGVILITLKK